MQLVGILNLQFIVSFVICTFFFLNFQAYEKNRNNLPVPMQYAGFAMYLLQCNGHCFPLWESLIFYNTCKVAYQFCTYLKPCAKTTDHPE